jgi:diguanylate cyclase (GGDEF)-like protein/PAS domain S-box-containing protein
MDTESRITERRAQVEPFAAAAHPEVEDLLAILESTNHLGYVIDFQSDRPEALIVGGSLEELTGYRPEELRLETWSDCIHPDDLAIVEEAMGRIRPQDPGETPVPQEIEYRIVRKSGEIVFVRERAWPDVGRAGNVLRILGSVVDISEEVREREEFRKFRAGYTELENRMLAVQRREAGIRARLEMERARSKLEKTKREMERALLASEVTMTGAHEIISDYCQRMFGGVPGAFYLAGGGGVFTPVSRWGEGALPEEIRVGDDSDLDGAAMQIPVEIDNVSGILYLDSDPEETVPGATKEFVEIVAWEIAEKLALLEARRLAERDELTGLYNLRYFLRQLKNELYRSARYGHPCALLMLDLDRFKYLNDTQGHQTGNRVLRDLAGLLQERVRETDSLARYGGEEMVIILPDTAREGAFQLAERLREAVSEREFVNAQGRPLGEEMKVTISVGVAVFPEDAADGPTLIEAADQALYQAKRGGRNRVEIYDAAGGGEGES